MQLCHCEEGDVLMTMMQLPLADVLRWGSGGGGAEHSGMQDMAYCILYPCKTCKNVVRRMIKWGLCWPSWDAKAVQVSKGMPCLN
jgi:hypothetical protein